MTLPGREVLQRESSPSRTLPTDSGTGFMVGISERGPTDRAVLCRNMSQVIAATGNRVTYGALYDAAEFFFRSGGSRLYLGRVFGPSPTVATANLSDGSTNTLRVDAITPGAWGAKLNTVVTHPTGSTFRIEVTHDDDGSLEASPEFATNADAVAWAANSSYIRLTDLAGGDPAAATTSLAGGTDDHSNIVDASWAAALGLFPKSLGPGQVMAPGRTTATGHQQLLDHAKNNNRRAFCDFADTATVSTLTGVSGTDRALASANRGGGFAPWCVVPGVAAGTTRTVPPAAGVAGRFARNLGRGLTANEAAAGPVLGDLEWVLSLTQPAWSDADRETLNEAGVNVLVNDPVEGVMCYGWRTFVNPVTDDNWSDLGNAGLYMEIAAKADAIASRFVFQKIDGRGKVFSRLGGALSGMLVPYFDNDALYGATFEEAAQVDVGDQVNTPETIADKEIRAVITLKMSPHGERVVIEIVKVANQESV